MKKQIVLLTLVAAALIAAPASSRAEDQPVTKSSSADATTPAPKKAGLPFHGKATAVDAAAMTVTVGKLTLNVTSETKLTKDGQPATLSEVTVGETVRGAYKKDDAGKLNATTIRIGAKAPPGGPKKKKAAQP